MVAIPTNYKMGTGLAATIMGQQAGLEAEQQGLSNLYQAMKMPQQALQGQEAAMLMNDPQYLQQKTANTLIELKNNYSAADFQQTLDAANRVRIRLDAAAGDPQKEQQIVQESLSALKIDPNSEFAQYAMKDPRGALTKFIQGVEVGLTGTGGAKQLGAERVADIRGENAMELAQLRGDIQSKLIGQRAATGGGAGKPLSMTQYEAQLRQRAGQGDAQAIQELQALEASRLQRATAGIEARNAPIMNLLQGRTGGAAPAPQAKGGVIKLD